MRLFFLLPLATSLISGYLCMRSADEMAYLTGTATVASLILTLVLAPWQVQLLVLGVTIFGTRKLLLKNAAKNETNVLTQSDRPQLETGVSTENDIAEIRGMYRGAPWMSDRAKIPAPQPDPTHLKYRGANVVPEKKVSSE